MHVALPPWSLPPRPKPPNPKSGAGGNRLPYFASRQDVTSRWCHPTRKRQKSPAKAKILLKPRGNVIFAHFSLRTAFMQITSSSLLEHTVHHPAKQISASYSAACRSTCNCTIHVKKIGIYSNSLPELVISFFSMWILPKELNSS